MTLNNIRQNGLIPMLIANGSSGSPLWLIVVLCLVGGVAAYFLGSMNFAVIISKYKFHDDIRRYGSGNGGMTNMLRTYGKAAAGFTLLGDAAKAAVSVLIGTLLAGEAGAFIAGLCCVIGHSFPIYYGFKGGKGIVVSAVTILCLDPLTFLVLFLIFVIIVAIADLVGAKLFVDMAHIAGLVAAGEHPNPVPYCDVVTTTTHKTLRGPRGGLILCKEEYLKSINSKVFPGMQGGPLEHVIAAKAICFGEALTPAFKAYQHQVKLNAAKLAEELVKRGFRIVSGGTDNHLMLIDLRPKHATGKAVANALDIAHITANKNMIPFDPEKPFVTSGIRVGTPAITTRGLKEAEMVRVADFIERGVELREDEAALAALGNEVQEFMADFPMPRF